MPAGAAALTHQFRSLPPAVQIRWKTVRWYSLHRLQRSMRPIRTGDSTAAALDALTKTSPAGRPAEPEEIAGAALYLASEVATGAGHWLAARYRGSDRGRSAAQHGGVV